MPFLTLMRLMVQHLACNRFRLTTPSRLHVTSQSSESSCFTLSHHHAIPGVIGTSIAASARLLAFPSAQQREAVALKLDMQPTQETATPSGLPLPPTLHATLNAADIGEGRIIVIGDVHGCPEELQMLLDKCEFRRGIDIAVFVGDLVNKGQAHTEAVRLVRSIGGITVRGNHDELALERYDTWRRTGTLDPKYGYLEAWNEEDVEYFRSMPFSLAIPSHGVLVVHAGIVPGIPLEQQRLNELINMRHVGPASLGEGLEALPKFPRSAGEPWATVYAGPQHVIFGHHARRRLQTCKYATGIDTGCVLGGQLTAAVLPSLQELRRRGLPLPPEAPVTLDAIGGSLVSVQAKRVYRQDTEDE